MGEHFWPPDRCPSHVFPLPQVNTCHSAFHSESQMHFIFLLFISLMKCNADWKKDSWWFTVVFPAPDIYQSLCHFPHTMWSALGLCTQVPTLENVPPSIHSELDWRKSSRCFPTYDTEGWVKPEVLQLQAELESPGKLVSSADSWSPPLESEYIQNPALLWHQPGLSHCQLPPGSLYCLLAGPLLLPSSSRSPCSRRTMGVILLKQKSSHIISLFRTLWCLLSQSGNRNSK